jgi:hypothetical protein
VVRKEPVKIKLITRRSEDTSSGLKPWFPGWFWERFGDHYAQISADTTLKLKSSIKDVSRATRKRCTSCRTTYETSDHISVCPGCGNKRVVGFVPDDIEALTKTMLLPKGVDDYDFVVGYEENGVWVKGSSEPGHSNTDNSLLVYVDRYPQDWEIVKRSLGLTRQKTKHPCAFLIANKPISQFIPLVTVTDSQVTSFTYSGVEAVGGLKMDFLVVNSLKDIQDCIKIVQERTSGLQKHSVIINDRRVPPHRLVVVPGGGLADIWDLPEDQKVFDDVAEGKTETVFQFNTSGAVKWLTHFNHVSKDGKKAIRSIADMAAFTALDRPGPLDVEVSNPDWNGPQTSPEARHNMLVEFARRARGGKGSGDVLKALDELIPETHGIMCFQEQLQYIYQKMTGCSGAEAEDFRTAVAKKKKDKVDQAHPGFIERAGAKIGEEAAAQLWETMRTWAQYGFNKSHAVCYAVIGYACAWLKHYYPLEWWCSVNRNATKDEVNEKFWRHCGKFITLPDIKISKENWVIEGTKIRAPISLLHGVGEKAHLVLCAYAPYNDIEDFAEKMVEYRDALKTKSRKPKKHPKTGVIKEIEVVSLGRCPVTRDTVYKLIVAGVMESLFPEDAGVSRCLEMYDDAIVAAALKRCKGTPADIKAWKSAHTSYRKQATKSYPDLDAISKYQVKKGVLPAYGTDLRSIVCQFNLPFLEVINNNKMWYKWDQHGNHGKTSQHDSVIGYEKLDTIVETKVLPSGGYRTAVLAYIEEKRAFRYGENKSKEAMDFTLEVGGGKYNFVHWPNREGVLNQSIKDIKVGSVVVVLLVRNDPQYPFSIKKIEVIRDAFGTVENKEEISDESEA